MTDPSSEIDREFATMTRRLSQALGRGYAVLRQRQAQQRSSAQILREIPAHKRDEVAAATRLAMARSRGDLNPEAADKVERAAAAPGQSAERHVAAARTERAEQLADDRAATAAREREENAALREQNADLRTELANDRSLSPDAGAGVLAGIALAAAIDSEAFQDVSASSQEAVQAPAVAAETSAEQAHTIDADEKFHGERSAGVDELLDTVNQHSMPDMLTHAANSQGSGPDLGAELPGQSLDVGTDAGADIEV